jgi:asparagine synthase (glutamine-hydrolysing)
LNEPPHAAAVARHLAVRHEVVELAANDLVQACDAVSERLAEPLGDSSLLPTWLVCRAARRLMTVALGGDGADELFGGYPNFVAILLIGITPLSSGTICSAERTAKEAKNR